MVEKKYDDDYASYMKQLQPINLGIFSEDELKIFKKDKGKGQFILQANIDGVVLEERWEFYEFEEGNFNNFNSNSIIYCIPTYVDMEKNFMNIHGGCDYQIEVFYEPLENSKINLPFEESERKLNPLKFVSSTTPGNMDLRVGLYLQTFSCKNLQVFNEDMDLFVKHDFDILVFPESCFTPFTVYMKAKSIFDIDAQEEFIEDCLNLSKYLDKAVVISSEDANKVLFSVYANANASEYETKFRIYVKHTMTDNSPFSDDDYSVHIDSLFSPIKYKGYSIGLTICYDCNHAPFSRMYGLQNIDLIINSTGGDVIYDKWYKYNKARSIENQCYNLVTMGGWQEDKNKNFTFGFNPNGGLILPVNMNDEEKPCKPGKCYIYDLSNCSLDSAPEMTINQIPKPSKNTDFDIPVGRCQEMLEKSEKIRENIYVYSINKFNVIFCLIDGNDIFQAEKVIPLLYDSALDKFNNRKYVIINRYNRIDESFFDEYLSIILKVRCLENFCVVLLESDNLNYCYQAGSARSLQVVKAENDKYSIDLKRAGGPDAIWTNKMGMKKAWRNNYKKLSQFMAKQIQ